MGKKKKDHKKKSSKKNKKEHKNKKSERSRSSSSDSTSSSTSSNSSTRSNTKIKENVTQSASAIMKNWALSQKSESLMFDKSDENNDKTNVSAFIWRKKNRKNRLR